MPYQDIPAKSELQVVSMRRDVVDRATKDEAARQRISAAGKYINMVKGGKHPKMGGSRHKLNPFVQDLEIKKKMWLKKNSE